MSAVLALLGLWLAFAGTHVLLSGPALRPRLIGRIGERAFLGLYSLVALATFVPLVRVFAAHRHAGPLLWTTFGPPDVARALNYLLMGAAFVLLAGSLLPGSAPPSSMQARGRPTVRGLTRITRHPMLSAFGLFGVAHLLVNGSLGDAVFFGGFPLFTWVGSRHQDARKVHDLPDYDAVVSTTSVIPFAAVVSGRQRLEAADFPLLATLIGVALTVLVRLYHQRLFGP
jgi:uncharacterized membrane protein